MKFWFCGSAGGKFTFGSGFNCLAAIVETARWKPLLLKLIVSPPSTCRERQHRTASPERKSIGWVEQVTGCRGICEPGVTVSSIT